MRRRTLFLLFALPVILLTACQSGDTEEAVNSSMEMPVYFRIPADGGYTTRAIGDPGDFGDEFTKPTMLYLFVVTVPQTGDPQISNHTVNLTADNWQKTTVGTETYYEYTNTVKVTLPENIKAEQRKAIRVYAAVSPMTLDNFSAVADEDGIRNLTADLPDDGHAYQYIRDIYSTPADHTTGTDYYGTVENPTASNPSVTLTLYHVAAKIDIIWNVATDIQSSVRLRQVSLYGLRHEACRLFRPMKNTPAATNTYRTSVTTDVGSQWLGRHSFYVIPCVQTDMMPLELHLWQDDDSSTDGFTQNIDIPMTETIFTPWVRQDILINGRVKRDE